ncbi:MAG: hypothetical protein E6R03_06045 [Hyphomicrobiaceae bacterium]|nr:MAG: hypothetical protein E6R03_06045 [Hyphomicrobiaceae bacterium]
MASDITRPPLARIGGGGPPGPAPGGGIGGAIGGRGGPGGGPGGGMAAAWGPLSLPMMMTLTLVPLLFLSLSPLPPFMRPGFDIDFLAETPSIGSPPSSLSVTTPPVA